MESSDEQIRLRNASMALHFLDLPGQKDLWDQAETLLDQGLTREAAPLIQRMIEESDRYPERIAELPEEWQECLAALRPARDKTERGAQEKQSAKLL